MAHFLDTNFFAFDKAIIFFFSELSCSPLTFLSRTFTFLGEKGLIYILVSVILMAFKPTRKLGVSLFGALCFATLFSTFTLKNIVARERPMFSDTFRHLWEKLNIPEEAEYSFPSGHVTSAMAVATALFIACNKKWSFLGFIWVIVMSFSRIYLIAHYPTDVIAGIIIGGISGLLSLEVTKLIYYILNKYPHNRICKFALEFDIRKLFKKEKAEEMRENEKKD